ncbi:cobalamin B12-binding domain-containing protein [Candidatus Poribacteria bacterium]|nr:cobalamin B12-binding domain-containing protein [Candidatus Poribacteria bacterium]
MRVPSMPLGVAYLASAVRDISDVTIMDAVAESDHEEPMDGDFTWYGSALSEIRSRIEDFKPDLVGIGCIFSSIFPVIRKVCREIKAIDPDIITITGGSYPTFMAEHCMKEPALDMIVLGEGEMTFREIIRRLSSGASLAEIDGLAFRDGDRTVVNPRTTWIEDLDTIRFPARDLLPMDAYKKIGIPHSLSFSGKNFAPMITSRGCPARCIYCSSTRFWGNRYRFRSPENVLDEIGGLISRWDIGEIQFEDDNTTANPKRAMSIFRGIIDRGYKIRFNFPNGLALWTLDERLVDLMVEAGCYEMILAFESGCQEVLRDIVKKPTNLEKAIKITRYIQHKGIRTDAFYIIGFPGETREQIRRTFRFANKVKTDLAYFFVANPLPGSELHRIAESRGMLPQGFNFENLTYSRSAYRDDVFPNGELERMAGRGFVKYAFRSFLRRPHVFLKRFLFDLFLKRPRYTVQILVRIWRRVSGAGKP